MALLSQPEDRYELALLQQQVSKVLADDVFVHQIDIRAYRDEFMRGTVFQLKGYILADHLENQTVEYVETTLPRWLKWLQRFVVERTYRISLDAYYTYPEARVAIPDLGRERKQIIFHKTRLPRFI